MRRSVGTVRPRSPLVLAECGGAAANEESTLSVTINSNEPQHMTQPELERALWAAANALRGPVDAGDFKAYVFPVMFFKWVSDNWDYRHWTVPGFMDTGLGGEFVNASIA